MEKSIYTHLKEIQASKARITQLLDLGLEHYKTNAKKLSPQLKRLTEAQAEIEKLEEEYKTYL